MNRIIHKLGILEERTKAFTELLNSIAFKLDCISKESMTIAELQIAKLLIDDGWGEWSEDGEIFHRIKRGEDEQ